MKDCLYMCPASKSDDDKNAVLINSNETENT